MTSPSHPRLSAAIGLCPIFQRLFGHEVSLPIKIYVVLRVLTARSFSFAPSYARALLIALMASCSMFAHSQDDRTSEQVDHILAQMHQLTVGHPTVTGVSRRVNGVYKRGDYTNILYDEFRLSNCVLHIPYKADSFAFFDDSRRPQVEVQRGEIQISLQSLDYSAISVVPVSESGPGDYDVPDWHSPYVQWHDGSGPLQDRIYVMSNPGYAKYYLLALGMQCGAKVPGFDVAEKHEHTLTADQREISRTAFAFFQTQLLQINSRIAFRTVLGEPARVGYYRNEQESIQYSGIVLEGDWLIVDYFDYVEDRTGQVVDLQPRRLRIDLTTVAPNRVAVKSADGADTAKQGAVLFSDRINLEDSGQERVLPVASKEQGDRVAKALTDLVRSHGGRNSKY